jgi:hypothetical protein
LASSVVACCISCSSFSNRGVNCSNRKL